MFLALIGLVVVGGVPGDVPLPETGYTAEAVVAPTIDGVLLPPPKEPEPTPTVSHSDVWTRLAECESGGDPTAVNPTGKYRGAFQFDIPTWLSVGMTGDPIDYSYAEQLAAAKRLHAKRGFYPWPTCARKLGLIND